VLAEHFLAVHEARISGGKPEVFVFQTDGIHEHWQVREIPTTNKQIHGNLSNSFTQTFPTQVEIM